MGGPQAADTLGSVRREQEGMEEFKQGVRDQFERQSQAYYSTARLWDDGVIDPADTRTVLGLALEAASRTPLAEVSYGVFRM